MAAINRPDGRAAASVLFTAASGMGKTTAQAAAIVAAVAYEYRFVPASQRRAFSIVDHKRDLIDLVLAGIAAECPAALGNTYYLRCFTDTGEPGAFELNLMRAERPGIPADVYGQNLATLVGRASGSGGVVAGPLGYRQQLLCAAALTAVADCGPDANVLWALDAMQDPTGGSIARLAALCHTERARRQLLQAAQDATPEIRSGVASRLRCLAPYEAAERMVGAQGCASWSRLTGPGTISLIDLSDPKGGAVEQIELYSNILVSQIGNFLLSRPSGRHHPASLIVDEAQICAYSLANSGIGPRFIETGRSKCLDLQILTQSTRSLRDASPAFAESLFVNCPYRVVGRMGESDASHFVREALGGGAQRSDATRLIAELVSLPPREFYLMTPGRRIRFTARTVDERKWDRACARHADAIAAVMTRLAPKPLPEPIRLHHVTDPVPDVHPTSATRRTRARSRFG